MVPSPVADNIAAMTIAPAFPYPHGPFLVEPDGALNAIRAPALRFAWRGRPCEARLAEGRLHISAGAGAPPYTAERPAQRAGALAAIGALPAELPEGWRLRLLPDHHLRVEQERRLTAPVTAIALVAALVGFALALDPHLDRLEAAGIAPPG
jgi:hypothetical protein